MNLLTAYAIIWNKTMKITLTKILIHMIYDLLMSMPFQWGDLTGSVLPDRVPSMHEVNFFENW